MTKPEASTTVESSRRSLRLGRRRKRRKTLVPVCLGLLGFLVVAGLSAGLLAYQAAVVRRQLEVALELTQRLRSDLAESNYVEAKATLGLVRERTSSARSIATGPLWKAASLIPFAGSNIRAVSDVSIAADDVIVHAATPLLDVYGSLAGDALSPQDGKINVASLQEAAPRISAAADTVRLSHERLASIELSALLPAVAAPLRDVSEQLGRIDRDLGAWSPAAQLVPSMLGADGPRNYLVLVQNSAEARATGGIPGALAMLHADDGQLRLGAQSSAGALGSFVPALQTDPEQEVLFTARIGTSMQNVNLTPDFPTAAATAKAMWEEKYGGQAIDGVIALDPVVLRHLLEATGPVSLIDPDILLLLQDTSLPSSLTHENVVRTLLSDVYREIEDPHAQDAYFAAVANLVFAAFTNGQGESGQLVKALGASITEGRLFLWSSNPQEQPVLAATGLAGSIAGQGPGDKDFGVYFNDGTGAKMDYYAARTVQILQACGDPGSGSYTVRLTAANHAPPDAATSLPAYVTGGGVFGVSPGHLRTNYVFYGPALSFAETATVNGQHVPLGSGRHGQRPVATVTLELEPGEAAEVNVVFSRVTGDSAPKLQVTPSLEPLENVVFPFSTKTCG